MIPTSIKKGRYVWAGVFLLCAITIPLVQAIRSVRGEGLHTPYWGLPWVLAMVGITVARYLWERRIWRTLPHYGCKCSYSLFGQLKVSLGCESCVSHILDRDVSGFCVNCSRPLASHLHRTVTCSECGETISVQELRYYALEFKPFGSWPWMRSTCAALQVALKNWFCSGSVQP